MMTALQKYKLQQGMAGGPQPMPMGPMGAGGRPAVAEGPGIADPYNSGMDAAPMMDPEDGMSEFGQFDQGQLGQFGQGQKKKRAYMGGM